MNSVTTVLFLLTKEVFPQRRGDINDGINQAGESKILSKQFDFSCSLSVKFSLSAATVNKWSIHIASSFCEQNKSA